VKKKQSAADSPLRVATEGDELVIRVGVNRLDGDNDHPTIPALDFVDRGRWVKDVIVEITKEDDMGASLLTSMLEDAIGEAIDNGSAGLAPDTPTHVGNCDFCDAIQAGVRYVETGRVCLECYKAGKNRR